MDTIHHSSGRGKQHDAGYCAGPLGSPEKPCNARRDPRSGALLDLEERVRLETMSLAVDPPRALLVRRVDKAEDFAGRLVDPVVLVVDPVRRTRGRLPAGAAQITLRRQRSVDSR